MIGHDDKKLARSEKIVKYTEAKATPEIVSQANKIVRGICVNRSESAETGQQEIKCEIISDILRHNGNKELLFVKYGVVSREREYGSMLKSE